MIKPHDFPPDLEELAERLLAFQDGYNAAEEALDCACGLYLAAHTSI